MQGDFLAGFCFYHSANFEPDLRKINHNSHDTVWRFLIQISMHRITAIKLRSSQNISFEMCAVTEICTSPWFYNRFAHTSADI